MILLIRWLAVTILIDMDSTQNLVPLFGSLAGNTLTVGGTVISGFAILYLIRGVSTTLADFIEGLPKIFANPKTIWEDTKTVEIRKIFGRAAIIGGAIAVGYGCRRFGTYLAHDGIIDISKSLGYHQ
jgi:hypothetical protein